MHDELILRVDILIIQIPNIPTVHGLLAIVTRRSPPLLERLARETSIRVNNNIGNNNIMCQGLRKGQFGSFDQNFRFCCELVKHTWIYM